MKMTVTATAVIAALSLSFTASAATVAEGVNCEGSTKVVFSSGGNTLAGNLYLPKDYAEGQSYPAVVVSHPWGGVKEQTAGLYAQKLAQDGFVTLAYDASNYGESSGGPKDFEDPAQRVADIRNAVSYLTTLKEVASDKIVTLGICAGGGYTLHEAQQDPRVKAVASVVAYDIGGAAREGIEGSPVSEADRRGLWQAVTEEWNRIAAGEQPVTGLLLPDKQDWTAQTNAFTREAYSYYREERGASPNARNTYHLASLGLHLGYYPLEHMDSIAPRPVLLIAGGKAETLKFSEEAYRRAKQPKTLVVYDGATHFALYDDPQYVESAVKRLAAFYSDAVK